MKISDTYSEPPMLAKPVPQHLWRVYVVAIANGTRYAATLHFMSHDAHKYFISRCKANGWKYRTKYYQRFTYASEAFDYLESKWAMRCDRGRI